MHLFTDLEKDKALAVSLQVLLPPDSAIKTLKPCPSYPVAETLNVAEPGDPLGGVDVSGVGSAVVYLRSHLVTSKQDGELRSRNHSHYHFPARPRLQPPLTFACRAICRATKDRLRSDTILATLVSTRPSMSVETQCSYLAQAKTATLPS